LFGKTQSCAGPAAPLTSCSFPDFHLFQLHMRPAPHTLPNLLLHLPPLSSAVSRIATPLNPKSPQPAEIPRAATLPPLFWTPPSSPPPFLVKWQNSPLVSCGFLLSVVCIVFSYPPTSDEHFPPIFFLMRPSLRAVSGSSPLFFSCLALSCSTLTNRPRPLLPERSSTSSSSAASAFFPTHKSFTTCRGLPRSSPAQTLSKNLPLSRANRWLILPIFYSFPPNVILCAGTTPPSVPSRFF